MPSQEPCEPSCCNLTVLPALLSHNALSNLSCSGSGVQLHGFSISGCNASAVVVTNGAAGAPFTELHHFPANPRQVMLADVVFEGHKAQFGAAVQVGCSSAPPRSQHQALVRH